MIFHLETNKCVFTKHLCLFLQNKLKIKYIGHWTLKFCFKFKLKLCLGLVRACEMTWFDSHYCMLLQTLLSKNQLSQQTFYINAISLFWIKSVIYICSYDNIISLNYDSWISKKKYMPCNQSYWWFIIGSLIQILLITKRRFYKFNAWILR